MSKLICEPCKRGSDSVVGIMYEGDKELIKPLWAAPKKCSRCSHSFESNERLILVKSQSEYICKNGHAADYPDVQVEAKEEEQTKEWRGHLLCEECGEELNINGAQL